MTNEHKSVSIRLSKIELELVKKHAKLGGISVSELFRKSVLENIEDSLDAIQASKEYEQTLLLTLYMKLRTS